MITFSRFPGIVVCCPSCDTSRTLAKGQAGYEAAQAAARNNGVIARIVCSDCVSKSQLLARSTTEVTSRGKQIVKKVGRSLKVVTLL